MFLPGPWVDPRISVIMSGVPHTVKTDRFCIAFVSQLYLPLPDYTF